MNLTKEILQKALKQGYAIPAFNINNLETLQGIVAGAIKAKSPIFVQVSQGGVKYAGLDYLTGLIQIAKKNHPDIPIIMHLDHGGDFNICKQAIDKGFDSVMIDASDKSFNENVKITKEVVDYAHKKNIFVEAELGQLNGIEDNINSDKPNFTNPKEAAQFVELTNCDSLAVSIGTSHGAYKFKGVRKHNTSQKTDLTHKKIKQGKINQESYSFSPPKGEPFLDFNQLKKIEDEIPNVPLVLHGASEVLPEYVNIINQYGGKIEGCRGLSKELLRKAAKTHICKINCDTDIRLAFTAILRRFLAKNEEIFDYRKYLELVKKELEQIAARKIKDLKSI